MPSKQFINFRQQSPGGGMPGLESNIPQPGTKDASGKWIIPAMPPDYTLVMPPLPEGFTGGLITINNVRGIRVSAPDVKKGRVLMYLHGGGFTIGSAAWSIPFLLHTVRTLNIECYSIEYSLAPKYKFPTQINECLAFYKGLLERGYDKIVIGGESAGASLSIAVTHYIRDNNLQPPIAVIALSGVGDMGSEKELYKYDFLSEMSGVILKAYAGDTDAKNPYLSPLYGNFKGFSPLLLQAGGAESFAAEAVHLAEAAARADVDVLLHIWKDMGHTFALEFGKYPEADAAMQEIMKFIEDRIELEYK